jgi:hypothetical protein
VNSTIRKQIAKLGAREVPFAPGYFVTRDGRVFSCRLSRGRALALLKPGRHKQGYLNYGLMIDGRVRTKRGHNIVASAWLPPRPTNATCVRHRDGDPTNNRDTNLAWSTQRRNIHDKWCHGTMATGDRNGRRLHPEAYAVGERTPMAKLSEKQVVEIKRRLRAGEKGNALAREFKVLKTTISHQNRAQLEAPRRRGYMNTGKAGSGKVLDAFVATVLARDAEK